jgi:SET domain-containing protein
MADDDQINNATFRVHPTNRNRINLVATRSIYHNQEILANYGNNYDHDTVHSTKRKSVALGPSENARYLAYYT